MQHHNLFPIQEDPEALLMRDFGFTPNVIAEFKQRMQERFPDFRIDFMSMYNNLQLWRERLALRQICDRETFTTMMKELHHLLLPYLTANEDVLAHFMEYGFWAQFDESVVRTDSPKLFVALARRADHPLHTRSKYVATTLRYYPTDNAEFAQKDNWDAVRAGAGYVPGRAVSREDVVEWLQKYHTYSLTDFFIEPGHEYSVNLDYNLACDILCRGSLQNVVKVIRLMGEERLLSYRDFDVRGSIVPFFQLLVRNNSVPTTFIYNLLQRFPIHEKPLHLAIDFLQDLLTTGDRDQSECQQVMQFFLDNNLALKHQHLREYTWHFMKDCYDDETRILARKLLGFDDVSYSPSQGP